MVFLDGVCSTQLASLEICTLPKAAEIMLRMFVYFLRCILLSVNEGRICLFLLHLICVGESSLIHPTHFPSSLAPPLRRGNAFQTHRFIHNEMKESLERFMPRCHFQAEINSLSVPLHHAQLKLLRARQLRSREVSVVPRTHRFAHLTEGFEFVWLDDSIAVAVEEGKE